MADENEIPKRPLVGLIIDCTDTFGRAIFRGVTRYANLQRRWLLFKDRDSVLGLDSAWPEFDGIIFAAAQWPIFQHGLTHCRYAVHCSGGGNPNGCPTVAIDDIAVGEQAARHLLDCRFEHFAFYDDRHYKVSDHRIEGFRRVLSARGYVPEISALHTETVRERASPQHRAALISWLKELPKPVGVMAFDDTSAHELAEACLEARIDVPERVAIVGVNNDDLLCESAWPPLSSVETDYTRVGYMAARVLERLLDGEKLEEADRDVLLPPLGVVQRQSTSTLAVQDKNLADAVRYIRQHACDPCSVSDVLRAVPVGRRWLERQFVIQLGRTPHDEIARVRIETGQRLLQRSELSVDEIAARCGFAEEKSFYQSFRRITGCTPATYRRMSLLGGARTATRTNQEKRA